MNACYRHYAGSTLSAQRVAQICGAETSVGEEEGSMHGAMNACYRHYAGSTLSAQRVAQICGAEESAAVVEAVPKSASVAVEDVILYAFSLVGVAAVVKVAYSAAVKPNSGDTVAFA